jgi:hypothetical protein
MSSETTQRWIKAVISIDADAPGQVLCPKCEKADLVAEDICVKGRKVERWVRCPGCGAQDFLLYASETTH